MVLPFPNPFLFSLFCVIFAFFALPRGTKNKTLLETAPYIIDLLFLELGGVPKVVAYLKDNIANTNGALAKAALVIAIITLRTRRANY